MNWAGTSSGGGDCGGERTPPGRRGVHLQGPRPTPLTINNNSRKIGKPPLPVPLGRPPRVPQREPREPIVIYTVSPKVIHTNAADFKDLVQRLTGMASSDEIAASSEEIAAGGPISPATRAAAMERVSPTGREREREWAGANTDLNLEGMENFDAALADLGQAPGILSPAPSNLPAVPPAMFSQPMESQTIPGFSDSLLSPFFMSGNCFFPSPSANQLFPGSFNVSPTLSPVFDFSNIFGP